MYSLDLATITLNEFEEIVMSRELSAGRRLLAFYLPNVVHRLEKSGIHDLAALRQLLRSRKGFPRLAEELVVSFEFLNALYREINYCVPKPLPLTTLGVFSEDELDRLAQAGIRTAENLYEASLTKQARQDLAERLELVDSHLMAGLELADLSRIDGVGPTYAKILRDSGIRNCGAHSKIDSRVVWERIQQAKNNNGYAKSKIGLKDIEYFRRLCAKLTSDIEW